MKKRAFQSNTPNPAKEEILQKIAELKGLLIIYFSQFVKMTYGQQSAGDAGIDFIVNCALKAALFPEIFAATFDKDDFNVKVKGLVDYQEFQAAIQDALDECGLAVKPCKNDGMFYANEVYGNFQRESGKTSKYEPPYNELKPFYAKSKAEKTNKEDKNKQQNGTPAPQPA
jgi:hypothetical protein